MLLRFDIRYFHTSSIDLIITMLLQSRLTGPLLLYQPIDCFSNSFQLCCCCLRRWTPHNHLHHAHIQGRPGQWRSIQTQSISFQQRKLSHSCTMILSDVIVIELRVFTQCRRVTQYLQPALLYLVPFGIIVPVIASAATGHLSHLIAYVFCHAKEAISFPCYSWYDYAV